MKVFSGTGEVWLLPFVQDNFPNHLFNFIA